MDIKLTPITRLSMTLDVEMNLDKTNIFNQKTYNSYLEMQKLSEAKLEKLIKSIFLTDALLFWTINGKDWAIPSLGIQVSSIPAVTEILLFASAITFFFLCAAL